MFKLFKLFRKKISLKLMILEEIEYRVSVKKFDADYLKGLMEIYEKL